MNSKANFKAVALARTLAIGLVAAALVSAPVQPVAAQATQNASSSIDLSVGRGRLISLPAAMTDIFVANDEVADVQVRSGRQLYIFGKKPGETSIYATDASGRVVFSTVARVGNNIETIDQMLSLAMPDASISANTMNGFVLLTGTVQSPDDAAEAELVQQGQSTLLHVPRRPDGCEVVLGGGAGFYAVQCFSYGMDGQHPIHG